MKNIRFYEAEKYKTSEYEKVESMIYKTMEKINQGDGNYSFKGCSDEALVTKLLESNEWEQGTGKGLARYMIMTHQGKRYYRTTEYIGTDKDIIYIEKEPDPIYVTSIVFEPEPELGENEPAAAFVSQYPLEDILDKYYVYCGDFYEKENEMDKENSYVEFASCSIEDIRNVLTLIGKHVYNKEDGDYIFLKIE
ncbi:MAG: hypothetical protein K6G88_08145 [Lachnospiraceae bacterium]|nr:hypothetical protein [Lachnospiraceae bacterium]